VSQRIGNSWHKVQAERWVDRILPAICMELVDNHFRTHVTSLFRFLLQDLDNGGIRREAISEVMTRWQLVDGVTVLTM
jgi:hypothetical protein